MTGSIPTQFGLMSNVRFVRINNNKLVGQLPKEIGNLTKIASLYIDSNQLNGTLPDVFDNLNQLERLYAYDNSLTGLIPSSIWRAQSLSRLDLRRNDLYGTVPDEYCEKMDLLELDDANWFIDAPKIDCQCCKRSCVLWDAVFNPMGSNIKCPNENVLNLFDDFGIRSTFIKDIHTNGTVGIPFKGICSSPTGCFNVKGEDMNDGLKLKEWHFGYSNTNKSIILSKPNDAICDVINICGNPIDSNHPRRRILNYFMQTLISNSSILYDTGSYEYKALCWMMGNEDDLGTIEHLDECDGTIFQFCIMGLFFSSTNYLNSMKPFSSSDHLCHFDGIKCGENNQFIEAINFQNKGLSGTLITEIGLIESLKVIDLSNNQMRGKIDEAIFNDTLPNLEIFNVNNNFFEGEVPIILLSHPRLRQFDISSNLFVGNLPSTFMCPSTLGKSTKFQVIYLYLYINHLFTFVFT